MNCELILSCKVLWGWAELGVGVFRSGWELCSIRSLIVRLPWGLLCADGLVLLADYLGGCGDGGVDWGPSFLMVEGVFWGFF